MSFTIGHPAVEGASLYYSTSYTNIMRSASSGGTGLLFQIETYLHSTGVGDLLVATFVNTSGDIFQCRDVVNLGEVAVGYSIFESLAVEAEAGDYIGWYRLNCNFRYQTGAGADGVYQAEGNHCVKGNSATYILSAYAKISLRGTGEIVVPACGGGGPVGLLVAQGII